jgi:hypothetical protein
MAAGACVVVIQAGDGVEPEKPTEVCQARVKVAAKSLCDGRFNLACKLQLFKNGD